MYSIRWINNLQEIPQAAWDAMALPLATPFLEYSWLNNLEISGSVSAETGWLPNHLTVWQGGDLLAAAPLYIKGHSYGEFIFDSDWVDLAQRMGMRYYPKLVGMTPITPAQGYRFLIVDGVDEKAITDLMLRSIDDFCREYRISGCHFLYADLEWKAQLLDRGYHEWINESYIWENQNYQNFDDYLADFNANQRRNIKRERKAVFNADLSLDMVGGDRIDRALCDLMYVYYADTCDKFGWWGSKYLTPEFFSLLADNYRDRTLFAVATDRSPSEPIAMSFCITKGDLLYGRYWGSREEIDCLHFEACYYKPIEWAIGNNIQTFDPGAGGRHKKRRGFPARANYSLHRFYQPQFDRILSDYFRQWNQRERQQIDTINRDLPMKSLQDA
jgi:uncharacterized protein